jgi:HSP20 family protein
MRGPSRPPTHPDLNAVGGDQGIKTARTVALDQGEGGASGVSWPSIPRMAFGETHMDSPVPVKHGAASATRPFTSVFGSLQREIDRLFEDFTPSFPTLRGEAEVKCRMDLAETKDGLELTVEAPGLDEKDVEVSVGDGVLTVSGEKKFETEQKDKSYRFIERGYGAFSRSIALPEGVKAEDIKASMAKGLLKVFIPTPAKAEPKKIEVKPSA